MLIRAIYFFIAGLVVPYIGMWFAGSFMLGSGESPNFIPMQIASLFTIFFSVGLFYLSKVEKRSQIKIFCLILSLVYAAVHLGILLPQDSQMYSLWFQATYFLKILVGVTAGIVLLEVARESQNEI